jgi:transposase
VPRAAGHEKMAARTARVPQILDHTCDSVTVKTAYRCRAYPDEAQQAVLSRTFGCVRVVWNRTLAARHNRWHLEGKAMSYAESDRALTAMKKDQTCSACGHLLVDLSLSTRHWRCPSCGTRHDRDINAAKNILAAGLAVARGSPGDACGAEVRHSGSSRVCSAAKQEPRPARAGIFALQGGD